MKRIVPVIVAPALALALAACGGEDSTSKPEGSAASASASTVTAQATSHNQQDVMFAQGMIPHHQQAIDMAEIAATRATMPEVKQLASAIEAAQGPEIQQMTGWLKSWGATVPPTDMGDMGHDMGDMGDGMMSDADMAKLNKLSGKAFDKAFLTMMIEHHEGAIAMARTEQASGRFPEAKAMAGEIVTSQTAEITKMRELLKTM